MRSMTTLPSGLERGPPANCSAASYVARTTTSPVSNLSTLSPVSHDAHLLESIESSIPVRTAAGRTSPQEKHHVDVRSLGSEGLNPKSRGARLTPHGPRQS